MHSDQMCQEVNLEVFSPKGDGSLVQPILGPWDLKNGPGFKPSGVHSPGFETPASPLSMSLTWGSVQVPLVLSFNICPDDELNICNKNLDPLTVVIVFVTHHTGPLKYLVAIGLKASLLLYECHPQTQLKVVIDMALMTPYFDALKERTYV